MDYDPDKRKLLSAVCHGSIFLSSLVISGGIPLVIFLVSEDPVIKENAKEALNFHLNVWVYGFVFGILTFVLIGYPLLLILFLASWVLPILAIVKVLGDNEKSYRYPFIWRIL